MGDILAVITQNILPIFVVAGFGFALQRWKRLDKQSLSSVVLNVFSPCLAFSALVNSQLSAQDLGGMALFTVVSILLMSVIGLATAKLLRLPRRETAALLILIMFVNGGNYGMTLNQLRYGTEGLARAVIYFLTSSMLVYTLGIFIASSGHLALRQALRRLFTFPAVYAAIAAIVVFHWQLTVPAPLMRAIEIAGAGAIPLLLVVLGMQIADLRQVTDGRPSLRLAVPAISLRLLVGPLVGVLVAGWLGMTGLNRSVAIIEASMPSAVLVIVLATEFRLAPAAVAVLVVVSTLISPLTIAAVITVLGL
ncbi:MAG TPA: AEC family transporter [Chloroflexota bacterium]|nr:AEC family transporter [Chloroflexota bacterium]